MEIKILQARLGEHESMVEEINGLMADGWGLVRLDVLQTPGSWLCYAQMARDTGEEDELPAWEDAVESLRYTCGTAESCSEEGCLMWAWCQKNLDENNPPANWDDPEELDQSE